MNARLERPEQERRKHLMAIAQERWIGAGERCKSAAVRRSVMWALCDIASKDGSGIWCSVASLADEAECSQSTVQNCLKDFEEEGLIRPDGTVSCRNGYTNRWCIDVAKLKALPLKRDIRKQRRGVHDVHPTPARGGPLPVHVVDPNLTPEPAHEPMAGEEEGSPSRSRDTSTREAGPSPAGKYGRTKHDPSLAPENPDFSAQPGGKNRIGPANRDERNVAGLAA